MKTGRIHSFAGSGRTWLGAVAVVGLIGIGAESTEAVLIGQAGNATIRNTVTVTYDDALGNPQTPETDTIDVTINTIDAAPIVKAFDPLSGATTSTGDTQVYTVTFITSSNGPGTISWSADDDSASNITLSATTPAFASGSAFLGATILDPTATQINVATTFTAGGASITFAVPNDGGVPTDAATTGGAINDNILNGLAVGDIVFLYDGTDTYGPFTVTAVNDPAVGNALDAAPGSISLQNNTGADITVTPQLGWAIVEAIDDALTVTQGAITDPTQPATWVTTVETTMGTATNTAAGSVTTEATQGMLSVTKYVRNVDSANGTGTAITFNGQEYFESGVNGDPDHILEYLIVITNEGAADATDVVLTDAIPTYTTYVPGSLQVSTDNDETVEVTISAGGETGAGDDDAGIILTDTGTDTTTVRSFTVYAGTGGDDHANGTNPLTGGNIAGGEQSAVIYRVTID